jgi:hypothetical protein
MKSTPPGSPSVNADDIIPLVEEAIQLVGVQFARLHADLARQGRHRREWHPWAPAFAWLFDLDPSRHPIQVAPIAALVARDMRLLRAIPGVMGEAPLRAEASRLIRRQREAALEELRAAGYYNLVGVRAEWTAVTRTDSADVLLPDVPLELQVKTRLPEDDPMRNETTVLQVIAKARPQLRGDRPGIIVMSVPGVGDWDRFARLDSARA